MLVSGKQLSHPQDAAKALDSFIEDATSGEVQWVHRDIISAIEQVSKHLAKAADASNNTKDAETES